MFPGTHLGADTEEQSSLTLRESQWELLEAQTIIQLILRQNGCKILPVQGNETTGWEIDDIHGAWQFPDRSTILVPDLTGRYRF